MSVYGNLRRSFPFLTPPFAGDDSEQPPLKPPTPQLPRQFLGNVVPPPDRPRTVTPQYGDVAAETAGIAPPVRNISAMGDAPSVPTPLVGRQPAPISTDMPDFGTAPTMQPIPQRPPYSTGDETRSYRAYPTQPRIDSATGQPVPGRSKVGIKLDEIRAMQENPDSDVNVDPAGNITVGAPHKHGRVKEALLGALYGALEGGRTGAGWRGAVGGAATGAITGAVSPRLVHALGRDYEIQSKQAEVDRELASQYKMSQIAENQAQAQAAARGPIQYKQDKDGNWVAVAGTQGAPVMVGDKPLTGKDPDAETEAQKNARLSADQRQKDRIAAQKARDEAAEKRKVSISVGGKSYRVNPDTAARIAQRQREMAGKPTKAQESATRAIIEEEAEENALSRRKETDGEVARLLEEQKKLKPGKYGAGKADQERSDQIDKQLADLRKESDNQQKIAETAAENKRKAEAEAKAGGEQPQWKYRKGAGAPSRFSSGSAPSAGRRQFNLGAWKADHPDATPSEIEAKRKQYADQNFVIVE